MIACDGTVIKIFARAVGPSRPPAEIWSSDAVCACGDRACV